MTRITTVVWRAVPFCVAAVATVTGACSPRVPRTDAERLTRGREIIDEMGTRLGSAQALSVTTREARDIVKPNGQPQTLTLTRKLTLRRPDRLYVETSGDQRNELWYDGVGLTMALHNEKVFGQARMPETLDRTLDAMNERYGISTPIGDFLYSSPSKALLSSTTTGGWVARETINGQPADHLSFKDNGVSWEIWIAASGDALPVKGIATFPGSRRLRRTEFTFSDWNFAPPIANDRFTPTVPAEYEGIAIVQRARVLRNMPAGEADAASTAGVKK
jgi:hypothetical protein